MHAFLSFLLFLMSINPTPHQTRQQETGQTPGKTQVATSTQAPTSSAIRSTVIRVIDGDTLVASIDGTETTIRLIGVNTPETVDPRTPVECFGAEASAEAKRLLKVSDTIQIETDPSQGATDKYGRMLAYVTLADGTLVNEHMIAAGYAYEYTYATPYKHQERFKAAEARARAEAVGLWTPGICESFSVEDHARAATLQSAADTQNEIDSNDTPTQAPQPDSAIICSYNAYNCSDFASREEAYNVLRTCGRDIHSLDGDGDGVPCEALR